MTKTDFRIALAILMFAMLPAAWSQGTAPDLDHVLTQMDSNAKNFRSAEASFVWDQYQKVIDETDTQKGKIYFRRQGNDTQMAADIDPGQRTQQQADRPPLHSGPLNETGEVCRPVAACLRVGHTRKNNTETLLKAGGLTD